MSEHSSMVMFHHRLPTSTANVEEATHPIFVTHDELDHDYFVVHNGVIRNSLELKKDHEKLGYVYNTVIETETITHLVAKKTGNKYYVEGNKLEKFNDSESLAIELARLLDGMTSKINTVGTVAFIAWKVNKTDGKLMSISYGHNSGNPMTIEDNKDHFFLSSVGGADLPEDIVYTLNTDGDMLGTTSQRQIPVGYLTEYGKNAVDTTGLYKTKYPLLNRTINEDIKPVTYTNKQGKTYDSYNEYYEETYGFNRDLRQNWDKEESKLTMVNKVGFTNEGNETEDESLSENIYGGNIDTTRDADSFVTVSTKLVKEYLNLEDSRTSMLAEIDTAEFLMQRNPDERSVAILKEEISAYESNIEILQARMNDIEDQYVEAYPSRPSFKKMLDAHIEQEVEEFEGVYDIQMT